MIENIITAQHLNDSMVACLFAVEIFTIVATATATSTVAVTFFGTLSILAIAINTVNFSANNQSSLNNQNEQNNFSVAIGKIHNLFVTAIIQGIANAIASSVSRNLADQTRPLQ